MGYIDGMSLYQYVGSDPVGRVDPWGLARTWPWSYWDINPLQAWPHLFYDVGSKVGRPLGELIGYEAGWNPQVNGTARKRRFNQIANGTYPLNANTTSGSSRTKDEVDGVGKLAGDLARMPGTGTGGPPPTVPGADDLGTNVAEKSLDKGLEASGEIGGKDAGGNSGSGNGSNTGNNSWHWYEPWTW